MAVKNKVIFKKRLFVIIGALLCAPIASAENIQGLISAKLTPLSNVRVSMQRMVQSKDRRYFMNLYAGVYNPRGILYDFIDEVDVGFKGTQKGDQLNLSSLADPQKGVTEGTYRLTGVLNANSGTLNALLYDSNGTERSIQFEPAFKVVNKPVFIFKFYGENDEQQPLGLALKRVDVLDKTNNQVVQSLTGFSAYGGSIAYMDMNFDGYYDVILSDLSAGKTVSDRRYIYWMYNPKTSKFQRSPQLEQLVGLPVLHGEKKQIDFGNGVRYQVEKGLIHKIAN